jgi:hypothetical protein
MTIQFNIPDAMGSRALNGFCKKNLYSIQGLPNETKLEFLKRMTIQRWREDISQAEEEADMREASRLARLSVETDITIT